MTAFKVKLNINPNIYLKDPISTDLGQRILKNGIILIDEIGLEDFTFRKLASKIGSTESSIYRYFENKHYFFIYILNWFWEWTSVTIDLNLLNVEDSEERMSRIIKVLIEISKDKNIAAIIDLDRLQRIVVREGSKAYHHKLVDDENASGFFLSYKALCKKIASVMLEINPDYQYSKALSTMLIESVSNNLYFSEHLPRLTDIQFTEDSSKLNQNLFKMMKQIIMSSLKYSDFET